MSVAVEGRIDQRGRSYRTLLYAAEEETAQPGQLDFLGNVEDQLGLWLRRKKDLDLDVRHDNDLTLGNATVEIVHHEGGHGRRGLRARLVEETPVGDWTTMLLASSEGWLELSVDNSQGRYAKVPNLARYLLECLPLKDGNLELTGEPVHIHPPQVDHLITTVLDPRRKGLVFIAGMEDEPEILDAFDQRVPRWTEQVHGLGQVYALTPDATRLFADRMGSFAVLPWTIRTFYPQVDRDDLSDARRHRYVSTATLARMDDHRIRQLLGTIARSHAYGRQEPDEVVRTRRVFDRLTTRRLSDAVTALPEAPQVELELEAAAPEGHGHVDQDSAIVALVKRVLGLEELTLESLKDRLARERVAAPTQQAATSSARQMEQQQHRIFELEDDLSVATRALDDAQLDEAELYEQVDELQSDLAEARAQAAWLQERLKDKGDYEGAFTQPSAEKPESRPETLLDVITRLQQGCLPHVVFCGDESKTEDVVPADGLGNAARVAWEAVQALADYAAAVANGRFEGSFDMYLRHGPADGHKIPVKKHGAAESPATMQQYGRERVFPVPTSVDPSGSTTMEAHVKLAQIGMTSPRMYYLDRVRDDSKIYIGYIGKHLRNTQTN